MAVPPKFASHRLLFCDPAATLSASSTTPPARHTLEIYLDYCCPYSAKMFQTLTQQICPLIRSNPVWAPNMELIFRQQVQPWHPQSTILHESAVVVNQLDPSKFWPYSTALFRHADDFFDVAVSTETRNETYKRLAKIAAAPEVGLDEMEVLNRLVVPTEPVGGERNMGNAATGDLKVLVKMARGSGVHVTPTVVFDGVVRGEISSGWTVEQWGEWLAQNVV